MGYIDDTYTERDDLDIVTVTDDLVADVGRYIVAEHIGKEHDYADIWEIDEKNCKFIGTVFFPELLYRGIRTRNGEYSEEKLTEFIREKFGKKPQEKTE